MEVIYCFIAFTGLSSFFSRGYVEYGMELFFQLRVHAFSGSEVPSRQIGPGADSSGRGRRQIEMRLEEKLHRIPRS